MTRPRDEHRESPALPVDPDVEVAAQRAGGPRPVHLRPAYIAVVLVGGSIGAAAREALSLMFPTATDGIPYVIFGINVVGAFLLGVLLEALVRRGPDEGRRRVLRLLLGTGVMGGFTTYSSLATDAARLIGSGAAGAGILYGLATVLIGAVATWAGIALAATAHRRRAAR